MTEISRAAKVEMLRIHHMYRSTAVVADDGEYHIFMQCACTYRQQLPGAGSVQDAEKARLNHLLDVLEGIWP